jgi:hypothetical protein
LSSKVHGFYDLKNLKNDFVHHINIQDKIFTPSPFFKKLRPIKQHGHYNGNQKT